MNLTAEICLHHSFICCSSLQKCDDDFCHAQVLGSVGCLLNHVAFSLLQFGSHSKKRPNNLVLGRTYDHHIYDLVEVGVENYKSMGSFSYDKKLAPKLGSKPFFVFIGEAFESVDELKHLKEVLLELFRGEVCPNH